MATKNSKAKFVNVVCAKCKNNQTVFGKSSTDVKCNKCGKLLVKTGGGKSRIVTMVKEVFRIN